MKGVVPSIAVGGVLGPLQLAEKPFNWEPPVLLKGDMRNAAITGMRFDGEIGNFVKINLFANPSGGKARTHIVRFGIQGGEFVNVMQNGAVVCRRVGVNTNGSLGYVCGLSGRGTRIGNRSHKQFVTIKVDRLEVGVVALGFACLDGRVEWVGIRFLNLGLGLDGLLELGVASVLDRGGVVITEETFADEEPDFNKIILSGAGDTLAEASEIGTFDSVGMRASFGQCVGMDVTVNLALKPALA